MKPSRITFFIFACALALGLRAAPVADWQTTLQTFDYATQTQVVEAAYLALNDDKATAELLAAARAAAPDIKTQDGRWLCASIFRLAGGDADVGVLKGWLSDAAVRADALRALAAIGTDGACKALVEALNAPGLSKSDASALVEALALSASDAAVPALLAVANGSDKELSAAAWLALGRSPAPAAVATLRDLPQNGANGALFAQLAAAKRLAANGASDDAVALLKKVWNATQDLRVRLAAVSCALSANLPCAPEMLAETLQQNDPRCEALSYRYFDKLPAEAQAKILNALKANPNAPSAYTILAEAGVRLPVASVLPFLSATDEETRALAQSLVSANADAAAFDAVLQTYLSASGDAETRALEVLLAMPPAADAWLAAAIPSSSDKAKALGVAKRRIAKACEPVALSLSESADAAVKQAAYDVLSVVGISGEPAEAIGFFTRAKTPQERYKALNTLRLSYRASADKDAFIAAVAAALANVSDAATADALVNLLGETGSPKALAILWGAYDRGAQTQVLRALSKWPSADVLARFAAIMRAPDAPDALKSLARNDYFAVLERVQTKISPEEMLAPMNTLADLITRKEDKMRLMSIAAQVPLKEARQKIIERYKNEADLKTELIQARKLHNDTLKKAGVSD